MKKLNESWYVFVLLALGFALCAYFIHRRLLYNESIKADFSSQDRRRAADETEIPQIYSK